MPNNSLHKIRRKFRDFAGNFCKGLSRSLTMLVGRLDHLPASEKEIHMLSCGKRLTDCLLAYQSFCIYSGRRHPLVIHDDGSILENDFERLRNLVPDARLVSRAEADSHMSQWLSSYPNCAQFRQDGVFFLKLFDFFAFAKSDAFIVLDNDILFFDRPAEVVRWVSTTADKLLFNSEHAESFAFPIKKLVDMGFRPSFALLNAGFGLVHRDVLNLELCERFLGKCWDNLNSIRKVHLLEQTSWAVLLEESPRPVELLPPTYEISNEVFRSSGTLMRHYTGFTKHDIMYVEALLSFPKLFFRNLAQYN